MATSPSTDNYTLGKGQLTFDEYVSGVLSGEKSLGNAPSFTFSLSIDKLDHYSSLGGLKVKDKSVISQVSPTCKFTLDEMSAENYARLFMGSTSTVTQTPTTDGSSQSTAISNAVAGQYYALDDRKVGIYRAVWTETVAGLAVADTITDTTSSTVCTVRKVQTISGTKYVWFDSISGAGGFTADGAWTSSGTGTGNWVGTPALVDDIVLDDGTNQSVSGSDFTVNVDQGQVYITSGTTLTLTSLTAHYVYQAGTITTINGLQKTSVEGQLRYISDNPEGPNVEIRMWKVSLTPDGDTAFIGDDWATASFSGEILKDSENHPSNPYLEVIV